MAEKVEIINLDINTSALVSKMAATKTEIDKLKQAQKDLAKSTEDTTEEFIQNEVEISRLQTSYNQQKSVVTQLSTATEAFATATAASTEAVNKEISTIAEARANNTQLLALRNQLNLKTEEGQAALAAINQKLNENNELIKENVSAYEQQKINIGNYTESIVEAASQMNPLNGGMSGFIGRAQEAGGVGNLMKTSLAGMAQGFMGVTKAALSFIVTPVGAILAAIVLAFALVKNAMNRSEEATNKITKIFQVFSGMVNSVLKALEPLGVFLIDGIVAGFDLAGKAADKALGLISKGLKAIGFDDAAESVDNFTESAKKSIQASKDLADSEARLEKAQRVAQKTQLEYQKQAEKLRQVRDDESKSMAERVKANEELGKVLQRQLADELKIANLALSVANQRIKAEGATKENLEKQAEALTNIADIQERVTGQESEQLANLNSLRKESADKAKEEKEKQVAAHNAAVDKAIQKSKEEIDLYIAQQGTRKKTVEEQLAFEETLLKKQTAALKKELDAGKITHLQYQTEVLNLKNEYSKKQIDVVVANADAELKAFNDKNKSLLDANKFLSDELYQQELQRLNDTQEAEAKAQTIKLQQGVINATEYAEAIKAIDDKYATDKAVVDKTKEDTDKAKAAADLQSKQELNQLSFQNEFDQATANEQLRYEQEIKDAEKSGADINLIKQKHAAIQSKIDKDKEQSKRDMAASTLGDVANLLGKETEAGKAAGIAQATINTYSGVAQVWSSPSVLPEPFATIQKVASTATVLASGLGAVKQITSTKTPKFAQGVIDLDGEGTSTSDSIPAMLSRGESVINARSTAMFKPLLSAINFAGGGVGFANGGIPLPDISAQGSSIINYDLLAAKLAQANSTLPAPIVSVQDIVSESNRVAVIEQAANL